jgi:branched-chain amino acid transport system permease protein
MMRLSTPRRLGLLAGAAMLAVALALPQSGLLDRYQIHLLNLVAIYGIAATGLTLFMGYAGQLSIGQAAFYGVGAYAGANISKLGWPFAASLLVAAGLAGLLGGLTGLVALRLRGFYLAVVTLALGLIAFQLFKNLDVLTGGVGGLGQIPAPSLFGYVIAAPERFCYFNILMLLAVIGLSVRLVRSPTGRAMRAIAANELAAQSVGVGSYQIKTAIFALAAAYAGLAGCLHAHLVRYIAPDDFGLTLSIQLLTMAIVGGVSSVVGGIIGSVVVTAAVEQLRAWPELQPLLYGGALVLLVRFLPTGLVGGVSRLLARDRAADSGAAAGSR